VVLENDFDEPGSVLAHCVPELVGEFFDGGGAGGFDTE
jgi:hypothetical protein